MFVCVCVFVHTFACVGLFVRRRPYVSRWANNCRVCGQSLYLMAIQPSCSDVISHMTICVWKGHCERLYSITRPGWLQTCLYVAASSYISWRLQVLCFPFLVFGIEAMETPPSTGTSVPEGDSRNQFTLSTNRYWHTRKNTSTEWTTERPHEQLHKSESDLHTIVVSCMVHWTWKNETFKHCFAVCFLFAVSYARVVSFALRGNCCRGLNLPATSVTCWMVKVERLNRVEPKQVMASQSTTVKRTPPCWHTEFEQSHNSVRIPSEAVEI